MHWIGKQSTDGIAHQTAVWSLVIARHIEQSDNGPTVCDLNPLVGWEQVGVVQPRERLGRPCGGDGQSHGATELQHVRPVRTQHRTGDRGWKERWKKPSCHCYEKKEEKKRNCTSVGARRHTNIQCRFCSSLAVVVLQISKSSSTRDSSRTLQRQNDHCIQQVAHQKPAEWCFHPVFFHRWA